MFSYIRGELAEIGTDHIVVDVGGVGYLLFLSGMAMSELPVPGTEIKAYTHLYVREDLVMLYGFLDRDELEMFRLLITVSGIGPKGGLAILSALTPEDLRFAVLSGDSKAIAKAPGVGAKTAQRVILDLKDKMSLEEAFEKKAQHVSQKLDGAQNSVKNEAIMALTALGYSSSESLKAVSKVEITPDMDVEEVLRTALKHMSIL